MIKKIGGKNKSQDQGYIVDVFSSLKFHEHSKYSNQIIDRIESYRIIKKGLTLDSNPKYTLQYI